MHSNKITYLENKISFQDPKNEFKALQAFNSFAEHYLKSHDKNLHLTYLKKTLQRNQKFVKLEIYFLDPES